MFDRCEITDCLEDCLKKHLQIDYASDVRDPGKDIIVSLAEANFWTLRTPESGNMMKRVTHKNIRQVSQ